MVVKTVSAAKGISTVASGLYDGTAKANAFPPFLNGFLWKRLYLESPLLEGVCPLPFGIGQWNSKAQTF
jgi:hypothetical protein